MLANKYGYPGEGSKTFSSCRVNNCAYANTNNMPSGCVSGTWSNPGG
jgi:hypothetical protein